MTLPHSRILSPTINPAKSSQSTNVNTEVNINLHSPNPSCSELPTAPTPVLYPPAADYQEVTPQPYQERSVSAPTYDADELNKTIGNLTDSVEFLKLVIRAYKDNTIRMNKYIVLTEEDLRNMLSTLLHGDKLEIVYDEDFEASCCAQNTQFAKISKIFVHKDGQVLNLKYAYSDIYSLFETYTISLKFVYKGQILA